MESPIAVLCGNIVHTFENVDDTSLKMHLKATESGNLSKTIAYDNGKEKVRTPYANLETKEIHDKPGQRAIVSNIRVYCFLFYTG